MRSVAAVVALVVCVHAGLWTLLQRQQSVANIDAPLASVSYSPYARSQHPDYGDRPTAEQIRADLKILSPYTHAIRTYSSTGGVELVPAIAAELGLKVTLGIWIDKNEARNEREIQAAIALARRYSNVNAIVVGNETMLRAEKSVDELISIIKRVKRHSTVPVTTGETYDVWLGLTDPNKPEKPGEAPKKLEAATKLAAAVDFIAAHILPYWDGAPASQAVERTILVYNQLRNMHRGKRIVIAEFGWPSGGYNMRNADPGRIEQASVLRDFVSRAEAIGIDYNVIEAFDQPWKTNEGGVGMYWGMFDAARQAKFAWSGPVSDPYHWKVAGLAVLLGVLLSLPLLARRGATMGEAVTLAVAANLVGAWFATVFAFWQSHYFVWGAAFALGLGILLLIPLVLIAFARIEEIASIAFGHGPRRLLSAVNVAPQSLPTSEPLTSPAFAPKVSIHVPAYREPPEMLKATLDALARLDYPAFECVVVINNTPDPAFWRPVEEHCRLLGERFKFVKEESVRGFKAGALRIALAQTAPDAEIIGVIDADYVVRPDWLKDLVPAFADPKVGMIQAPQDHRDGDRSLMHHAMNGEYAGFFDIGMVQRNEANAIIVHGTMCLIRRAAMDEAGGWSSDTIVEDTDLGLKVLEGGWQIHYTNRRYGHGLLPDTFHAFKTQRYRWAYGGFQILRKHWRNLLPGMTTLTREQKREFALGWLNWLGAESIGVLVAVFNLIWVPVVAFVGIAIPDKILTIPILAAFAVALAHFLTLYRLRVAIPLGQMMGAVVAAMAVQWTVARAVACGIWKESLPFMRTAKGGTTKKGPDFPAFWEAVLAALLLIGAVVVVMTNYKQIREVNIFALVLVVQSLPFLAAVAIAALEGTRLNSFAFWESLEAKLAGTLPRPAAEAPVQLKAEKQVETVQ
jgi:exo-beta-1,3-glucanase (GH17 family)/cellulose synthase/poly-beta-1,6-N-acetylglucosamine synthase-like glycosyltransferase